jgi:hypothetical protein
MQYYLTTHEYVGPNQAYVSERTIIEIRTIPICYNLSHAPCIVGWAGTTNDWARYGCGVFDTLESAIDAAKTEWGHLRELDEPYWGNEDYIAAAYYIGEYAPMSYEEADNWLAETMGCDVTADTTDSELAELAEKYEWALRNDGHTLDGHAMAILEATREYLKSIAD